MAILDSFPGNVGSLVSSLTAAMSLAEADMRCTFDWDGTSGIPCTAGKAKHGLEMDPLSGLWRLERSVELIVRTVSLPDPDDHPQPKDEIVVYLSETDAGTRYKIRSVENSFNTTLTLKCVQPNHTS